MTKQVKSKQRVAAHGEVFTAEREVEAMCDLVGQETERIDSRFLEPACGEGNFLTAILKRKLAVVKKKYRRSAYDWERNALLALGSLYGVELLQDNVLACRERLFAIWDKEYKSVCKRECSEDTRQSARFVLERNIVCGNALTLMRVDEAGEDTQEEIAFSEWTFPFNDARMQRKDYTFAELLAQAEDPRKAPDARRDPDGAPHDGGVLLQTYIAHYRHIREAGKEDRRDGEGLA